MRNSMHHFLMRNFVRGVLIVSLPFGAAIAQSTAATPETVDGPLAPVSWFVGGTWVTDVPDHGGTTHVENRIRWAPNHQAIEFNTNFDGKPHYNGFYAYDPVKKSIGFYYTAAEGELTIGTATPDSDGKTLHQEFDLMEPAGQSKHLRSTIAREGKDAYVFTVFVQKDGNWTQVFKTRYERRPE
jgi:hypothetical protein